MNWVSVDDQLPPFVSANEAAILLVYATGDKMPVALAQYHERKGFRCHPAVNNRVTHWMVIKEPIK